MKKALLIGINYTEIDNQQTLYGCIDDIISIRNMLIDAYDYDNDNITMLRDDYPNRLPTYYNIICGLQSLLLESGNLDEIWIHYSGHGRQQENPESIKGTGMDDMIVPVDYETSGYITDTMLLSFIKQIKCRAILIFDCCHSGTICDLQWSFEYVPTEPFYTLRKIDNVIVENPNIYVFSGCKDDQNSEDVYSVFFKESIGLFTLSFIECLRNVHHNTSILELYIDICYLLYSQGYKQTPVLSCSTNNPDYVITKTTKK